MLDIERDLDIFTEQKIEITRRAKDYTDITSKEGEFARSFQGPASRKNQLALENYGILDTVSTFNPHKGIPCEWSFNTLDRFIGRLEVNRVVYKDGKPYSFEFTFYGRQRSLANVFGSDRLSDIDWSDYDHDLTYNNVVNSWSGLLASGALLYPIVDTLPNYYLGPEDQNIPGNILNASNGILLTELKPAIRFTTFLKEIFEQYDQILTGDLVNDSGSDWADLFILPNRLSGASQLPDQLNDNICNYQGGSTGTITTVDTEEQILSYTLIQDDAGQFSAGTYTAAIAGTHLVSMSNVIQLFSATPPAFGKYTIYMRVNGIDVESFSQIVTPDSTPGILVINIPAVSLTLDVGDELEFFYRRESLTVGIVTFNGNNTALASSLFNIIGPANQLGQTVSLNDQMTEDKITEFIGSIAKAWNLALIPTDTVNEWEMVSIRDYYAAGTVRDWTTYIDTSNMTFDKPKVYKEIIMQYAESDAAIQQAFTDATGRRYGSINIRPDVEFGEEKLEVKHPCNIIPPSLFRIVDEVGEPTGQFADITIHKSLNIEGKPVKEPLLLFYYNGVKSTTFPYYMQNGVSGVNPTFQDNYIYPHISSTKDFPDPDGTSVTLPYSLERDLLGSIPTGTAYDRYWEQELELQYDTANRMLVNARAVLPTLQFLDYKLNDEIFLEKKYWRILEIRHDQDGKNARVTLIGSRNFNVPNGRTVKPGGELEWESDPSSLQKSANNANPKGASFYANLLRAQIQPNVLRYTEVVTNITQQVLNEINEIGGRFRSWDDES